MAHSPRLVVYAALAANVGIAVAKFIAAAISGSSAMLSEGVHSLVDSVNEVLLLHGLRRSQRPPDRDNPLGFGRELYFWSFIVALLVLALGAGFSLYEGVNHILSPEPLRDPTLNYIVLAVGAVFEGASWWLSLKSVQRRKGKLSYFEAFRTTKDPTTFSVLFEDSAALLGLAIAALGVYLSHALGDPRIDGWASIGIAVVLALASIMLARESKALLIGEPAQPKLLAQVCSIAGKVKGVEAVNGMLTVQMGPDQVLVAVSAAFDDRLTTVDIEECVRTIEARTKEAKLPIVALFVKPQTPERWRERLRELDGTGEP
ncbi:cation diffusion facilitator family transporter [Luteibacter sp. UNCMF366Tsu5.1]|uniref:cation diffusion facilitator family transporter n=1 Tax=Luteibacter sp. UNCMF366Tsu5.1 TaxID=1502758 RepID=UPI000908939B|nr:cation diffusion facilitator family transporter [Luteibacter sp. UNCMF366Tsu5.1]SFW18555.1 cation diffusion facilitator family transporter [Luteibacter sp. UNCMF366Tsu5.1]